jgi:hypothetical protein
LDVSAENDSSIGDSQISDAYDLPSALRIDKRSRASKYRYLISQSVSFKHLSLEF